MGIDQTFFDKIAAIAAAQGVVPGGSAAILGDCTFLTDWASGDTRRDLAEFQERLGLARAETLDIGGNPTITLDLHEPLPDALRGQFDLVIDAGTMHCCFDVARVLENALDLMKDRAAILHVSAFTGFTGRCYYKIDPSMFADFYDQNGFERVELWVKPSVPHGMLYALRRKFRRLMGKPVARLVALKHGALQITASDAFSLVFSDKPSTLRPAVLPNDAVILCAASRTQRQIFKRPIPTFFSAKR